MATKKCPVCGVSVKVENLERHVRNQHPRATVDPESLLTTEEREDLGRSAAGARPVLTKTGVRIIAIVSVVVAVALVLVILNPFASGALKPGDSAPNFSATTTDGTTITLLNLRGAPVLLEFMDVDCPHCINEAPVLGGVWDVYGTRVRFVSLDANFIPPDDTAARIVAFKAQFNTTWDYCVPDPNLVQLYHVTGTPNIFIIDAKGTITQIYLGETSAATLSTALNQALSG